jgi:hypothetical protein
MKRKVLATLGGVLFLYGALNGPVRAQDSTATNPEIEKLKAQLAAQQEQIDQLRRMLEEEKKVLEQASRPQLPNVGQVASTTPIVPAGEAAPALQSGLHGETEVAPALHPGLSGALRPQEVGEEPASPLQLRIGTASFTPVGFVDATAVFRTRDIGSSIGTNFGSTPYSNVNTGLGKVSEFRLSAQNSRIGLRVDAAVHGVKVLGYLESDFLGIQATNAGVSTHSDSLRMRLYWVDLRSGGWEILGGQSWSMLTPGRKGISPLPADIFYSQDMDTNYQVGIPWSRAPQFRAVYHASDAVTLGFAMEQSEQYGGGSGGGGAVTLPAGLSALANTQINVGAATYTTPNLHPDFQAKVAFDPVVNGKLMHIEFAGFLTSFKTANPTTLKTYTSQGGGGEANFNLELVKGLHLIVNTFLSDGGGRYLFGQSPDLTLRADASPSALHSKATADGLEYQFHNTVLFAYYGGIYIGKDVIIDTANKNALVGYGYKGSPNSQNRTIQEGTVGFNSTFWKNPKYGALNFIFQYSYLFRNPWSPPANGQRSANNNMIWADLRYTIPGSAPTLGK